MNDPFASFDEIVIIQAENPDGDSLASSLALEQIFAAQNKQTHLYCPMMIPRHLRYLPGWDRVSSELPNRFDASVIVDTSSISLLAKVFSASQEPIISSRPIIIIDHHDLEADIPYEYINLSNKVAAATGEVIFDLAKKWNWPLNDTARDMIAVSIMSDTLGLVTAETTPSTYRVMGDLVEAGVKIHELDEQRRDTMRRESEITDYKGQLLQRITYRLDGRLAEIVIPWEEIETYSDKYNPSALVLDDMRLTIGVAVAVAYKIYSDGHITGKIRANAETPIAAGIGEALGGGGHMYAAGFKVFDTDIETIKARVGEVVERLLEAM